MLIFVGLNLPKGTISLRILRLFEDPTLMYTLL
ncbi:unnamed protein product [Acanthoscelides obtectus]|uniref:Uncharacterized protein n=1 Tax=Acanthoscelides obtectus TaxID=200917 RepID=A0A9P0LHI0_ACAOB|nr:unnamed protein product [Acanthoscelides obtectus]CAK1632246.1 hypothetical protein AOBTE_LOCUS7434 [Acanthoscelides obtectus]